MSDPDYDDVPDGDPEARAFADEEAALAVNRDVFEKGMARLNRTYAFIKARPDAVLDLEWLDRNGGRTRTVSIKQFHFIEAPHRIEMRTARSKVSKPPSVLWFNSRKRREYIDADYYGPNETVPRGHLNLYHGFACMSEKGEWPRLREFLREIVCAGDPLVYDYVLRLIQWKIKNPTKNPEVGLLLLGEVGLGKGTFAYLFKLIFGWDHYLQFTDPAQAQNKYNTLIAGRFVIFYDETFYGHDPRIKQKIKGEITEPTITIEPKFVSPFQMRNTALRLFASNEVAALPIDANDRRLVVLAFANLHQEDHVYFAALRKAMEGGEVAAFVHDALAADLTAFEKVRRSPVATKAKAVLAQITGNEVQAFLYRTLRSDYLPGIIQSETTKQNRRDIWLAEAVYIDGYEMYNSYIVYMGREHQARKPMSQFQFWHEIRRVIPSREIRSVSVWVRGKSQERLRRFPSRATARAAWDKYAKRPVDWDNAVKVEGELDLGDSLDINDLAYRGYHQ